MKDLHYRHASENKLPAALISGACAFALVFFVLAQSGLGYSAVFHALVLLFGAIAIFFAFRYYLSFRTYHLTYMNSRHVLTVTDTQGRRLSTVFYLYLDEVKELSFLSRREQRQKKKSKTPKCDKKFVFSNTLRPERRICIEADTELGKTLLVLGSDAVFYRALCERVELAREQSAQTKGQESQA